MITMYLDLITVQLKQTTKQFEKDLIKEMQEENEEASSDMKWDMYIYGAATTLILGGISFAAFSFLKKNS